MINFNSSEYNSPGLDEMLQHKTSIIETIELTSLACPEQYDCFDEFGNQVGYFRLRHGYFQVCCPDHKFGPIYETEDVQGDGEFIDDAERITELEHAIDAVDNYYMFQQKTITQSFDTDENPFYTKIDPDNYSDQQMMQDLYEYQRSNFDPCEVMELRRRGPAKTYKECISKLLRRHRLRRHIMFPEANGCDGLSDAHIESELAYMLSENSEFITSIDIINWLFDKTKDDFTKLFREYSKLGVNAF